MRSLCLTRQQLLAFGLVMFKPFFLVFLAFFNGFLVIFKIFKPFFMVFFPWGFVFRGFLGGFLGDCWVFLKGLGLFRVAFGQLQVPFFFPQKKWGEAFIGVQGGEKGSLGFSRVFLLVSRIFLRFSSGFECLVLLFW